MINFILTYFLKSKNYLITILIFFFILIFIIFYFKTKKEILNLNNQIQEYQRIEQEIKNQNFNVKQNVEIIKKRTSNLNIDDRKRLLEKMFSE